MNGTYFKINLKKLKKKMKFVVFHCKYLEYRVLLTCFGNVFTATVAESASSLRNRSNLKLFDL